MEVFGFWRNKLVNWVIKSGYQKVWIKGGPWISRVKGLKLFVISFCSFSHTCYVSPPLGAQCFGSPSWAVSSCSRIYQGISLGICKARCFWPTLRWLEYVVRCRWGALGINIHESLHPLLGFLLSAFAFNLTNLFVFTPMTIEQVQNFGEPFFLRHS